MQGQEAQAAIVSYGVSDPEYAAQEAEFIYSRNRLNVSITRAKSKCAIILSRQVLEAPPSVWDSLQVAEGLDLYGELCNWSDSIEKRLRLCLTPLN
jgi:superfamily I DNA and/or RNA helicase